MNKQSVIVGVIALTTLFSYSGNAFGQVRSKKPDRGTYRSPILEVVEVEPIDRRVDHESIKIVKSRTSITPPPVPAGEEFVDAYVEEFSAEPTVEQTAGWSDQTILWDESAVLHDASCDGCDSVGCDSIGTCGASGAHNWANSSLSFDPNRWFGSIEVLLMFHRGFGLPPLVTTGPEGDPATAGQLGQPGTDILFGGNRTQDGLRAGGRLTLGTWIDPSRSRSVVFRGWFAGRDTTNFRTDQSQNSVIARPFQNVSDGPAAAQDTQLIAFPNRATGSISVRASSELFGGDLSARQKWFSRYGGTVDLLYGYQYMRLNQDLGISSSSISQDDDFAPVGSVLAIDDTFDIENEFHGAQLGLASRYREGCWSFRSLAKIGFGSLRRSATLRGETFTSIDGVNAVDPNGLLVRSTNTGSQNDSTFSWVPELDFSIGWHRYPRVDLTFGYSVIALTDAIQVSELIDPDLASNLSDPPLGQQRPSLRPRSQTFYAQGIYFGLQHVY